MGSAAPAKRKSDKSGPAAKRSKADTTSKGSVGGAGSGTDATEILASIPDAVLPDVDSSKKFNFFEHQQKLSQQSSAMQDTASIPEAQPDCLVGMTFVFTGTMPTLSREQGQDLVKRYGGRVTGSISGKTTCVVIGDEAGPSKIEKIKKLKIKAIDESGFLQLLGEMPAGGGSGEAAVKAMEKRKTEEEKIQKEAARMAEQMKKETEAAAARAKMAEEEIAARKKAAASSAEIKMEVDDEEDEMPIRRTVANTVKSKGKAKSKTSSPHPFSKPVEDPTTRLWTDKYAPTSLDQLCGNRLAIERLYKWLANYKRNRSFGFSESAADPSAAYRAVIISGPPGIGKTSAAHIAAKSLGYDVIESNASDTRSKSLLTNTISQRLDNTSVESMFQSAGEPGFHGAASGGAGKGNVCLIMDEVDGMSAGDRGGVGAMAAMCRKTSVPIILICNERNLPKMRPFDRVAFDIPFRRPDVNAIRPRILSIAMAEGVTIDNGVLDQLVQSTRGDIRQIINVISAFARVEKSMGFDRTKSLSKQWEKETILRPFDIVGKYLSGATYAPSSGVSLNNKIELYFNDHDFAPLMVQENYLNTAPSKASSTKGGHLELVARAAESISDGDLVDRYIHGSQQQWSLMPFHGVMSCVRPSFFIAGQAKSRYNFTNFLGNNSKAGKYGRILQELQSHVRPSIWCNRMELRLQYMSMLTQKLLVPLEQQGTDGIEQVMDTMDNYYLTKDDWDLMMEFSPGTEARAKKIPTAVKSAFTRKYNSTPHAMPFMKVLDTKLGAAIPIKTEVPDIEDVIEDDVEIPDVDEVEEEDQATTADPEAELSKDKYVKIGKPKASASRKGKATTTRGTTKSRASTSSRGRGGKRK